MPRRNSKVTVRRADGSVEVVAASSFRKKSKRAITRANRRSEHWRAIRRAALKRDDYRCRACRGTERLEVHHLTYARFGREHLEDVVTLCQRCHATEHQWQERRR